MGIYFKMTNEVSSGGGGGGVGGMDTHNVR